MLVAVTLLPFVWRTLGLVYLVAAAAARRDLPVARRGGCAARRPPPAPALLFHYSLLYLALLFVALAVDPLL